MKYFQIKLLLCETLKFWWTENLRVIFCFNRTYFCICVQYVSKVNEKKKLTFESEDSQSHSHSYSYSTLEKGFQVLRTSWVDEKQMLWVWKYSKAKKRN